VHDDYTLTLPPAAPPGVYQLICGLYDARSGERLQLDTGVGDAIVIPVKLEVE
jgi:hypothetical protein